MVALCVPDKVLFFLLFVGIGGAVALDLWCLLTRLMGVVILDWALMGRWLIGFCRGHTRLCDYCHALPEARRISPRTNFAVRMSCHGRDCRFCVPPSRGEAVLGWGLHYLFSIGYACVVLLFWGEGYIAHPSLWPMIVVCFGVSTLMGQAVVSPMMGIGIFARRHYNPKMALALIMAGHAVFAMAQYELAIVFADFL